MIDNFMIRCREALLRNPRATARRWQVRADRRLHAVERRESADFESRFVCEPGPGRIVLGRARMLAGNPCWIGLPIDEFLNGHSWVTGSTGAGKTFLVLGLLLQLLEQEVCTLVVVDMKGELTQILLELGLPALSTRMGPRLLQNLRIIQPFGKHLPSLRITEPEVGVPREIQAFNLAASIGDALGDEMGARMHRVYLRLVLLAIELRLPLTEIARWLESPARFAREARRSADPVLREYGTTVFPREHPATLRSLASRADVFLFLPEVRAALCAPTCVSLPDALEKGITVIDLGNPPAGAERAQRFWAGILLGRLTRSILSRPVRPDSRRTLVVIEEFQEGVGRAPEQFSRLLALARFKRVSLLLANQQVAQLDRNLVKLLRTNTAVEAAFRCNLDDAKNIGHALPVPSGTERPSQVRRGLVEEFTRLPDRTYYLWAKRLFQAQRVRSPRLDLAALQEAASRVAPETLDFIRRGSVALDERPASVAEVVETDPRMIESIGPGFLTPIEPVADADFPVIG